MNPSDTSINNKYVYLYTGYGTGPVSRAQAEKSFKKYLGGRSVRLVTIDDPSYFQNPKRMTDPKAIVFPGGSAIDMKSVLLESGIQGIKSLVEDYQSSYIGFCAGGYLAATTDYKHKNKTVRLDFKLGLSKYLNYGPAYPLEGEPSLKTAKAVLVQTHRDSEPFYIYWNGGGYYNFANPNQDSTLAFYATKGLVPHERLAVVCERHHGTQVVVSYVHPETRLTPEEVEQYIPHLENKEEYLASAPQQELLFNEICIEAEVK